MNSQFFAGKTALVIGAGREGGIAITCARLLADYGAAVAVADLPGAAQRDLVQRLPRPERHSAHSVDVTDPASVDSCLEEVLERHSRIDAALLASAVLKNEPFLDIALAEWTRVLTVNLTGMFIVGQAVAKHMREQGGGRIVCVASNAGRVPRLHNAAYGSSKAGLIHLVRVMALELAPSGITVNALCPGSTATWMALDNKSEGNPELVKNLVEGSLAEWRTGIPLGKLADAEDQAQAAAFLLSDAAKHITGQALAVDGGQTFY